MGIYFARSMFNQIEGSRAAAMMAKRDEMRDRDGGC